MVEALNRVHVYSSPYVCKDNGFPELLHQPRQSTQIPPRKPSDQPPHHTTGDFRKFVLPLVSSYRYEGNEVDSGLAESEAKLLHEHISNKEYSHDDVINLLATRSKAQIKATLNRYKDDFGQEIDKDLEADPNDEFLATLRATVKCLTCPENYFQEVISLAIDGKGTDEGALTRVVSTRAEVDMKIIMDEYNQHNSAPLHQAIAKDTHGDYEKMLLALIGHDDAQKKMSVKNKN